MNLSKVRVIKSNYCSKISFIINILVYISLSTLSADIEAFTITTEPDAHILHGEIIGVRYEGGNPLLVLCDIVSPDGGGQ